MDKPWTVKKKSIGKNLLSSLIFFIFWILFIFQRVINEEKISNIFYFMDQPGIVNKIVNLILIFLNFL